MCMVWQLEEKAVYFICKILKSQFSTPHIRFFPLSAPASLSICIFSLHYPHNALLRYKNKATDHAQQTIKDEE